MEEEWNRRHIEVKELMSKKGGRGRRGRKQAVSRGPYAAPYLKPLWSREERQKIAYAQEFADYNLVDGVEEYMREQAEQEYILHGG